MSETASTSEFVTKLTAVVAIVGLAFQVLYNEKQVNLLTETLTQDRQQSARDREERNDQFLKEKAPFLVIAKCCNPQTIEMAEFVDHEGRLLRQSAVVLKGHEGKSEINHGDTGPFVAQVENVGGGPALECRVRWTIERGIQHDGTELSAEKCDRPTYYNDYLWPKVIHPGRVAEIRHVPGIVTEDEALTLRWLEGTVRMECRDIAGKDHCFSQRFTMGTYYDPLRPGFVKSQDGAYNQAKLMFHFDELDEYDGPVPRRRHVVAKPPLLH